ncbi:MAG: CoA transferase [Chloroflexi bacterium]|nr:CoA transferase [Chloroflexota bacterium]
MESGLRGSRLALRGVRVVDLTSMWAGPLCTRVLADLGAEVIKIEMPARPDGTRSNPGYFSWLNRNKLAVALDLSVPAAKECFKRLVKVSDVVVESFSSRVMKNLRLDYSVLRELKPDIVMLSMPAYGSSGPYANYVAYGPGLEASSGMAAITGYRDGDPMLSGSAYGDPVAGMHGVVAVLAGLRCRRRTGKGQWIDLSQREALSQMFGEVFVRAARGNNDLAWGNRELTMVPHGCYRCRGDDRWIALAVGSDEEWRGLCQVMGRAGLADDPRFASTEARRVNEDEVDRVVELWTQQMERDEAMRVLQAAHLAAGVVMDARDLANDPHLAARGFFEIGMDVEGNWGAFPSLPWRVAGWARPHPNPLPEGEGTGPPLPLGEETYPLPSVMEERTGLKKPARAPRVGEHNRRVLGELLGLSDAEIEGLA